MSLRNRIGRWLRRNASRIHRLANKIDPWPARLISAGPGRRVTAEEKK